MTYRLRWFIQWSRVHDAWHCVACGVRAAGETYLEPCDGKVKTKTRQVHETLIHTTAAGSGNRIVHKESCTFYRDYVLELPVSTALAS